VVEESHKYKHERACWLGDYTACLIIRQANDCDHEEGSCEGQDQDLG